MSGRKGNGIQTCSSWLQIIGLALMLVTLGLVSLLVNRDLNGAGNGGVTSSEFLQSSNPTVGPDRPCEWVEKVTLNGNSARTSFQRYPKPRGTACADECVSEGTCSGDDYMDDGPDGSNDLRPFCNATDFSKCKGTCQVYTDCPIPALIYGTDSMVMTMCYGGTCLSQALLYYSGIPTTPITPLKPTFFYDGYYAMGSESAICRYVLLDNTPENPTSKRCLDTFYLSETISPYLFLCGYTYKCNRPNFLGIGSDGAIQITDTGGHPYTRFNSDGSVNISVNPVFQSFFEGVNNTDDLRNATKRALDYAATHPDALAALRQDSGSQPSVKRGLQQKISLHELRMGINHKNNNKESEVVTKKDSTKGNDAKNEKQDDKTGNTNSDENENDDDNNTSDKPKDKDITDSSNKNPSAEGNKKVTHAKDDKKTGTTKSHQNIKSKLQH